MAIASRARDDEAIRRGIEAWLRASEPGHADATVGPPSRPAAGLSSDTCFLTVTRQQRTEDIVVRLPPAGEGLFPEYDVAQQVAVQNALHTAGIPTVPARYEPDDAWLGVPFMVMPRIEGHVLATNPPYPTAGWLVDGGPERQRRVLHAFLTTLAALHRTPPAVLSTRTTDAPTLATTLAQWDDYLAWAAGATAPPAYLLDAARWCRDHVPTVAGPPAIVWGDAQLANCVLHDDGEIAALLDFELAGFGPPELDLGWYYALHDMTVATAGGADLPGFGTRAEQLAVYEAALGRPVADLAWFEVFALVRSGSIMVRIARLLAAQGVDDSWLTRGNPTQAALDRLLAGE